MTELDTFSINVQRYSKNQAQNWIFGPPYGGIRSNICASSEIFITKKPCSRVSSLSVLLVKQRIDVSEPPLLQGLGVTYAIHLYLAGKLVVDFL